MDENVNQINQVNAPQETQQPVQSEVPSPAPEVKKSSPLASLQGLFGKFKGAVSSDKLKIILPRALVILVFLVTLAILAPKVLTMIRGTKPTPTPIPTASPSPTPEVYNPSPYANDEGVLAIEKSIQDLEGELQIVNFREDTLMIPSVDWDVNFE